MARKHKVATHGLEGKAVGREKGEEDLRRIGYGNPCGFASLHGSGRVGGEAVTKV